MNAKYYVISSADYEGERLNRTPFDTIEQAKAAAEQGEASADIVEILEAKDNVLTAILEWDGWPREWHKPRFL